MRIKVLLIVVIIYLTAEVLTVSPPRPRATRQLPEYLQPPPHIIGPLQPPSRNRPPPAKPRGHQHQPPFKNHPSRPEISTSLAQRVARWFFENGNEDENSQQSYEIKQQSAPWAKPHYGPPKHPRNFHGPPRPPPFRGPNRPPHFLGPPRPPYGPPPPPHTLNLPQNSGHGHRPPVPLKAPSPDQGKCNPCNKVPWVPLSHTATQGFRNIEQLPLEDFNGGQNAPEFPPFSGPSGNDRPIDGPPDSSYGPPLLPHVAPGPPFNSGPSDSYGQPLQSPSNQFGPPYPSTSDHQDLRQGSAFGGQSFNKHQSNELAINVNEQFGYPGGNDPQAAATHHNTQDGSLQLVPEGGQSKPSGGSADDIEVVKSVRVADFLASVEYPLEIIQSPVIDIDKSPTKSVNGDHKATTSSHSIQSTTHDQNVAQSNKDTVKQKGSNYGQDNAKGNSIGDHSHGQNVDQKEQQATMHQVVSTANGKIIKGRPIVVDGSFLTDSSEENKVSNALRPFASKGLTNFTYDRENKFTSSGPNKYQTSEQTSGTSILDFTPPLQSQPQGTSLIHNINNLNIFTQQLPPSGPFTNNFQQTPNKGNFPLGITSKLPPSNNPLSSPSPFNNNFQHHPPAPVDVLKDSNSYEQPSDNAVLLKSPPKTGLKPYVVTSPSLDTSSWVPVSTTTNGQQAWNSSPVGQHIFSVPDNQGVATFNNAGMLPPPPPRHYQVNKKPKQIQVIVPYTSSKQLLQYQLDRPTFDNSGWLPLQLDDKSNQGRKVPDTNCTTILRGNSFANREQWQKCREFPFETNRHSTSAVSQGLEDYHQQEESRTVTATIAQNRPTGAIHHIFAPNIRALLKGEEDRTSPESLMFKLQKNIDEWTALEYSGGKGPEKVREDEQRKGTTSLLHLLVPSKKIPDAYLTTTPSTFDDETSENMIATAVPSIKKTTKPNKISVKSYHDHDISSSNVNSRKLLPDRNSTNKIQQNLEVKSAQATNEKRTDKNERNGKWSVEANLILSEESTARSWDTTQPISSSQETKLAHHSWDHVEMSISPITKEKVYVVTPMSVWNPNSTPSPYHVYNRFLPLSQSSASHTYSLPTTPYPSSTLEKDAFPFRNDIAPRNKSFHTPRFLVRPTPAPNQQRGVIHNITENRRNSPADNTSTSVLPAYSPPDGTRVHTITGHSKVVTLPTTATTSHWKWTGYDVSKETTGPPDEAESFLQSLARLLNPGTGPNKAAGREAKKT